MAEATPEVPKKASTTLGTRILNNILNEGATREKMDRLLDAHALAVKGKLADHVFAVRREASLLQDSVSRTIDKATPRPVQSAPIIKDIYAQQARLVKAGLKWPSSMSNILDSQRESTWGFEQTKQLRTKLADELFGSDSVSGPMRSVMYKTWKNLTTSLGDAANNANLGNVWDKAEAASKHYYDNYRGVFENGKYTQSPIRRALGGQNAKDIMEPISGKDAQRTRDILKSDERFNKYSLPDLRRDVRYYKTAEGVVRFSAPSRITMGYAVAIALIRPEWGLPMLAARIGLPRAIQYGMSRSAPETTGRFPSETLTNPNP
jgi:hypothetical protein